MRLTRWFFALFAPALFTLFSSTTVTGIRPQALDRPAQRDVMRHLRGGAPPVHVVRLGERNDAAVKTYLTRLRDRYSSVLDRPWDNKYANHRNVKQWSR
ncbi:Uncharacterized protein FWK35_00027529 [Aphis craccivora]|uniref:Uncharacterized protein n=1 Tax=Aphis craccivora TaxID=307492 RepID=A0A6G0Z0H4_APHCR|nr:Uncharacterized protein FWK35_00027529 [Aphis craccivora]